MTTSPVNRTIRAEELLGRPVNDAQGKNLGRVYELEAKRVGHDLCVTALLVGPRAWLTRFGWTTKAHGRRVPWEAITSLSPVIIVKGKTEG